jgi:hypothetical protein
MIVKVGRLLLLWLLAMLLLVLDMPAGEVLGMFTGACVMWVVLGPAVRIVRSLASTSTHEDYPTSVGWVRLESGRRVPWVPCGALTPHGSHVWRGLADTGDRWCRGAFDDHTWEAIDRTA